MNRLSGVLVIITSLTLLGSAVYPQSKPPAIYIDKGACPFECCAYRKWKVEKTTIAYARPDKRSKVIGKFKAGSTAVGLTGEVRTIPGKYVVFKAHGAYKPGDTLWVYTPLGEGLYKVWFNGKMFDQELEYVEGPFEHASPKCEETPNCWGKLESKSQVEWGVKVRSAAGWIGWSNQAENFSGKDTCGI